MNREHCAHPTFTALVLAACVASLLQQSAGAQAVRRKGAAGLSLADKTTVSLVLVTGDNAAAFRARAWQTTLEKLSVPFRIRGGTAADKIEIRETKLGPLRKVTVVGRIDRNGRMIFADRTFTRNDAAKLAEWIRELKTYGKQGEPRGKPLWGLSKAQFGVLFSDLSAAVATDVHGKSLSKAVAELGLPTKYAVRYSVTAREALRKELRKKPGDFTKSPGSESGPVPVRKKVKGQSLGTAFALVLRDYGLGFRPLRTPAGDIELVVDPLAEAKDAWPVGWKPRKSRPDTAPKLFKMMPVELDKVKLVDVFGAVTTKTGVPIHVDYRAAQARGIDVDALVVSYPARRASYSLLLRGVTTRKKLSYILRTDEAGQPFVWITAWSPGSTEE